MYIEFHCALQYKVAQDRLTDEEQCETDQRRQLYLCHAKNLGIPRDDIFQP